MALRSCPKFCAAELDGERRPQLALLLGQRLLGALQAMHRRAVQSAPHAHEAVEVVELEEGEGGQHDAAHDLDAATKRGVLDNLARHPPTEHGRAPQHRLPRTLVNAVWFLVATEKLKRGKTEVMGIAADENVTLKLTLKS